jgi:hypothetical protein
LWGRALETRFLWIAVPLLLASGCATVFKGEQSTIRVTSEPVCAPVYVNGVPSGFTPVTLKLPSRNNYVVQLEMPGYQYAATATYSTLGGGWLVLDILLLIIPVIVDAATGAWYYNEPDTLHFALQKGESPPSGHAPQVGTVEQCLEPGLAAQRMSEEEARLRKEAQVRCLETAESLTSPQLVAWAKADCQYPRAPAPPNLSPSKGVGDRCTWSAECSPGLGCPSGHCIPWEVTPASK